MEGVQAEIATDHAVIILRLHPVIAQGTGFRGERIVVRHEQTAIAEATEILGREETVAAEVTDGSHAAAFVARPDGLRGILDHKQAMLFSQSHDSIHVSTLAKKMHWNDGLRPLGHFGPGVVHVDVEGRGMDVYEHWRRPGAGHAACRCEECERRTEHFISGADLQGHQREKDGVRAGGNADRMFRLHQLTDLLFECAHLGAHDEVARLEHALEGRRKLC